MSNLSENFVDANMQQDSSRLCEKPHKSLMDSSTHLYLPRPDPKDCDGIEIKKTRYKQLANKELRDELTKCNREMKDFTSLMMNSVCKIDKTMKSVYKTDYEKSDIPITQYKSLMMAVESPIHLPITPALGVKDIYKDPIRFRYSAMESPAIQPAKTIALLKVSETCPFWNEAFTGCSEYMDTVSKMGMINMKNQQQYLKPLLPRRSFDNCNLPKST